MNAVVTLQASLHDVPVRLDKFLSETVEHMTRSKIQDCIRQSLVSVAGETITSPSYILKTPAEITLLQRETPPPELCAQNIPLDIIFEDEALIVLNKPPGLVVHPGAGTPDGTLVNALLYHTQH